MPLSNQTHNLRKRRSFPRSRSLGEPGYRLFHAEEKKWIIKIGESCRQKTTGGLRPHNPVVTRSLAVNGGMFPSFKSLLTDSCSGSRARIPGS